MLIGAHIGPEPTTDRFVVVMVRVSQANSFMMIVLLHVQCFLSFKHIHQFGL